VYNQNRLCDQSYIFRNSSSRRVRLTCQASSTGGHSTRTYVKCTVAATVLTYLFKIFSSRALVALVDQFWRMMCNESLLTPQIQKKNFLLATMRKLSRTISWLHYFWSRIVICPEFETLRIRFCVPFSNASNTPQWQ
jgi:hypothetical protein